MKHFEGHSPLWNEWSLTPSMGPRLLYRPIRLTFRPEADRKPRGVVLPANQSRMATGQWPETIQSLTTQATRPSTGKSDSATEKDLISRSFKRTHAVPGGETGQTEIPTGQQQTEPESVGYSSQDTTLHEMR